MSDRTSVISIRRGNKSHGFVYQSISQLAQGQCLVGVSESPRQCPRYCIGSTEDLESWESKSRGLVLDEDLADVQFICQRRDFDERRRKVTGQTTMKGMGVTAQLRSLPCAGAGVRVPGQIFSCSHEFHTFGEFDGGTAQISVEVSSSKSTDPLRGQSHPLGQAPQA